MTDAKPNKKTIYEIGLGRKSLLSISVLALAPFVLSAPILVVWRLSRGQWLDALTPLVLAIALIWAFSFILLHLISSMRTKIEIDDEKLSLVAPTWRGPTPAPPYKNETMSFAEIDGVQTRSELYRAAGILTSMRSFAVTRGHDRTVLGYMKENATDPAFPYDDIAKEVAIRSAVPITDMGRIRAGTQYGALFRGQPKSNARQIDQRAMTAIAKRNDDVLRAMVLGLLVLAALGFAIDMYQSGFFGLEGLTGQPDGS